MPQHLADLGQRGAAGATSGSPVRGETDALPSWGPGCRRAGAHAERSIQWHTGPESRGRGFGCARNTRRLVLRGRPCRRYAAIASPTSAGRGSAVRWPLCRGRSPVRRSSQYHRARERPLHLNAIPVVRAGARWRSRDAPSRCADRYWPATDGPGPPQSREGSMASTSWPRRERQQPNPASPLRDSARTAGRSATRWSGASRASDATAALGAGQIARHRRHTGARA